MQAILEVGKLIYFLPCQTEDLSSIGTSLRQRSGETKITKSDMTALIYQDIRRFYVSMHHVAHVHESHGAKRVVNEFGNVQFRQVDLVLQ